MLLLQPALVRDQAPRRVRASLPRLLPPLQLLVAEKLLPAGRNFVRDDVGFDGPRRGQEQVLLDKEKRRSSLLDSGWSCPRGFGECMTLLQFVP